MVFRNQFLWHNFIFVNMKVLTIIQARMSSERLPGKVLMNLENKPILQHIIEFLKHSKFSDEIIIATSKEKEDDEIENLAKKINVKCFRGELDDVLKRYFDCAKFYSGDLIVRITADNPLIDPLIVDKIIKICKKTKCEFASTMIHETFPHGYLVEAMTFSLLEKIHHTQKDKLNREHVTPYLRKNYKSLNFREVCAPKHYERPNWRLTLDHLEDYELLSKIFSKLYSHNNFIPYLKVVNYLDVHSELIKLNQKYNN
jgi:spore coat polysaccharide biosynthesis protein SpsF (cytidylyltransferase family)